ncbi:MAG: hypothetical protein A2X94_03515 [Bdellovibrionales bacterium GWB1_55_8]|nr:MAG: hypothetical protein A2X94_03515 [Bdellovibrionales bacterium GWB1_55_8]
MNHRGIAAALMLLTTLLTGCYEVKPFALASAGDAQGATPVTATSGVIPSPVAAPLVAPLVANDEAVAIEILF